MNWRERKLNEFNAILAILADDPGNTYWTNRGACVLAELVIDAMEAEQ